jgi:16S rRNA (guanine527-N7)-methyltransferase
VLDEPDAAPTELAAGAAALGVSLGDDAATLLLRYLERIYLWNRTAGLTTVARGDALRLHLLDSLSIVRFLPACGPFADLGSGAGLPGIPVAVALPDCTVTLVESRRRKCSFLTDTIRELSLRNCRVSGTDARRLADSPARYAAIMARAFVAPSALADIAGNLLAPGGRLVVMGARRDADLDGVSSENLTRTADERFVLPGGTERRRIIVLEKPAAALPQSP